MAMQSLILKDVSLEYETNGETIRAVSGACLELHIGDRVRIDGPSGSGKSSLLSAMAGLLAPTQGTVACQNSDLHSFDLNELSADERADYRRENVAMTLQGYSLLDGLTVAENLQIAQKLAGQRSNSEWSNHCVETLGLVALLERSGLELSGGQRQRASLCRCLSMNAPIILIDEPTSALDAANTERVCELLSDISSESILVCVSHDPNFEIEANKRLELNNGLLEGAN